jgi:hypothetical protein
MANVAGEGSQYPFWKGPNIRNESLPERHCQSKRNRHWLRTRPLLGGAQCKGNASPRRSDASRGHCQGNRDYLLSGLIPARWSPDFAYFFDGHEGQKAAQNRFLDGADGSLDASEQHMPSPVCHLRKTPEERYEANAQGQRHRNQDRRGRRSSRDALCRVHFIDLGANGPGFKG